MTNYIIATIKPWNIDAYHRHVAHLPGQWHLITKKDDLTPKLIEELQPRYIFFPHWSWIVPQEILKTTECVCFHMTDVPYGRGGSPLQNLIVRGHTDTKLTALRMVEELDAGPVYLKEPLSLQGSASEIFERVADLVYKMAKDIVNENIQPIAQTGDVVAFDRRTPEMSALPQNAPLESIYDHIRMLDADTYPPAFLKYGNLILKFSNAKTDAQGQVVQAHVTIEEIDE